MHLLNANGSRGIYKLPQKKLISLNKEILGSLMMVRKEWQIKTKMDSKVVNNLN